MTGKRPHPDSEGLFLSRKSASDIANGDIDAPGSYIVGRIFSKNPTKNQYTSRHPSRFERKGRLSGRLHRRQASKEARASRG
jgi:hypothetical protein